MRRYAGFWRHILWGMRRRDPRGKRCARLASGLNAGDARGIGAERNHRPNTEMAGVPIILESVEQLWNWGTCSCGDCGALVRQTEPSAQPLPQRPSRSVREGRISEFELGPGQRATSKDRAATVWGQPTLRSSGGGQPLNRNGSTCRLITMPTPLRQGHLHRPRVAAFGHQGAVARQFHVWRPP